MAISPPVKSTKRRQASRISEMILVDAQTIEMHFEPAHATWRISANFELIPKHLFEPGEAADPTLRTSEYFAQLHRRPIGSGPFKLEAWNSDELILSRYEGFDVADRPMLIRGLKVRWIQSADAAMTAFLDGELDLFELTDEQYRTQIYSDAFQRVGAEARRPSSRYHYILWNCNDEGGRFADSRVRRALAMAINTDRIKAEVTNNLAAACFGPWAADSPFCEPTLRRFAHKPKAARQILRDSSGPPAVGDRREKGSSNPDRIEALDFELLVQQGDARGQATAEIVRLCLADVGVGVTITDVENRTALIQRLRDGHFDACLMATTPGVDPELHYAEFVTDGTLNFGGYTNPNVDRLLGEASQSVDEQARIRLYRSIHRILYEDQPRTYLFHEPSLWAVSHRLSGVRFSNRGPYYFQPGVIDWWLARDGDL